jgi:hypothetical protein
LGQRWLWRRPVRPRYASPGRSAVAERPAQPWVHGDQRFAAERNGFDHGGGISRPDQSGTPDMGVN